MEFSVVIPSHDPHLYCFREVAQSVQWALRELGHDCSFVCGPTPLRSEPRPIYFGLPLGQIPKDAILYNGEQVSSQSIWAARRLDQIYKNHTVWDYSAANADRYAQYGLPRPAVVQPGYCPLLEGRLPKVAKTHDVVFFGSNNERRERVLRELQDIGLSVLRVPFGLYGSERDAVIAQASLCINIHFYDNAIFESVRCSYLMHNRMAVLSEPDAENAFRKWGVSYADYESLAQTAKALLMSDAMAAAVLMQEHALRQIPIKDDVGAALEALDHKPVTYVEKPPGSTHELTLSMIVKDESEVIARCLESVKPYIKRWCIVDTGSTDGTQEIIKACLADVPGQLHECPWKEYDGSRNEALGLAQALCEGSGWLLLIDADEIFIVEGQLEIPEAFDGYHVRVTYCLGGCPTWARPTLLRASKPWYYELPRHEGLYCRLPAPVPPRPLDHVTILSTKDGTRSREDEYERFSEDARVLEAWLANNPRHPQRGRAQYYIAQSYRDAATGRRPFDRPSMQKAVTSYLKRATMGGYDQEVHSALLWAADAMGKLDYPWEQIQQRYLEAFNQRPGRAEALFAVGEHYRKLGQYALAELFLSVAAAIPLTADIFPDVKRDIYVWRAKEEWGVALSWLGHWKEARDLYREVLACELPPDHRARIEQNFQEAMKQAAE